jgi:mono/diheme cytochrome c family protein
MRRKLHIVAMLAGVSLLMAWWVTLPNTLSETDLPDYAPDAIAGERIFWASGCGSCHASPVDGKRAREAQRLVLGGGLEIDTPFGIFRAPNISTHPDDGIGGWSMIDFVNAMQRGVSPEGKHYYPAFPYTSYARMATEDVMDLKAFLDTLPPVAGRIADHALAFPWSLRRGVGAWKRRYLEPGFIVEVDSGDAMIMRGRDLVEGAGHCGECHTPRNQFGGQITGRWLAGAPNPEGKGKVSNITPAGKNTSGWSVGDLSYYFESGFTPDFDTVGGSMVAVQENLAMLTKADRDAIATYLKSVPAAE